MAIRTGMDGDGVLDTTTITIRRPSSLLTIMVKVVGASSTESELQADLRLQVKILTEILDRDHGLLIPITRTRRMGVA